MSARRSTLRNLSNIMLKSMDSPPYDITAISPPAACSNSPSLSHIRYNAIIAAKGEISCSFFPVLGYLRLARASSKITAASLRISGTGDQGFP